MTWRWLLRDAPATTSGTSPDFLTREEAEGWMGAEWRRLLDEGHLAATLVEDAEEHYTMKLTED